jgi:hypothetical protein
MKKRKLDLLYRNSGTAAATKIQRIAFNISRSNAADAGPWNAPKLMSEEGSALAKRTGPGSAYEIPYVDDRKRFSVSDREVEAWRKYEAGDMTEWEDPTGETDPDYKLFCTNEHSEAERFDPDRQRQIDEQEPHEGYDEPEPDDEEEMAEENNRLSRTEGAFDRQRLFRAIDRLTRRTKKRLAKGHDGRSYGRDNRGRSYSACSGTIGGIQEWNAAFARGEVV